MKNLKILKVKNEDKNGKKRITLFMEDENKKPIEGKIWNISLEDLPDKTVLMPGNIIDLADYSFNSEYDTYTIRACELVSYGKQITKEARNRMWHEIIEIGEGITKPSLREPVLFLINHYAEEFKIKPASYLHHHNYVGGLLRHTYEVVMNAKALLSVAQDVDSDYVFAGALIHDVFKVREYEVDPITGLVTRVIPSDIYGTNLRHIAEITSWVVGQVGDDKLAHIVASHHGRKEWGTLVEPNTKEAHIVHQCDMLSTFTGSVTIDELPLEMLK